MVDSIFVTEKTAFFGKYELTRRIARGGMAEIFLAIEHGIEDVQREVAIKRILPHMSESDDFVTMFMDEARVATRLAHPNIAHIYNFGSIDGVYFLAMEFIEGLTCSKLIRWKYGEIPIEVTLRIVADVCAALAYAHDLRDANGRRLGVVHRDVTPQNVMVSRSGVAKLLDFGVARASTQVHSTNAGHVKGKLGYIAPEIFRGDDLDHRADIFSIGALLYEMIAGEKLFRREVEAATIASILNDEPPSLAETRGLSPKIDEILAKAVVKNPSERYPTAGDMQDDIEEFIADSGLVATQYRVGKFVHEQMRRVAAARKANKARAADESGIPSYSSSPGSLPTIDIDIDDSGSFRGWSFDSSEPSASGVSWSPPPVAEKAVDLLRVPSYSSEPVSGQVLVRTKRRRAAIIVAVVVLALFAGIAIVFFPSGQRDAVDSQGARGGISSGTVVPGPSSVDADPRDRQDAVEVVEMLPDEAGPAQEAADSGRSIIDAESSGPTLTVESGADDSTQVEEPRARGKLYLHTNPWSKVRLGGRNLGTTPLQGVSLRAGSHTLRFIDAEGRTHSKRVRIRPGADTKVFFDLRSGGSGE